MKEMGHIAYVEDMRDRRCAGFEALTAVFKKSHMFSDITPCSSFKINDVSE
jgi:hypothetical protein